MKKVSILLVLALFVCFYASITMAAEVSSIGYIDVNKVFKDYKEAKSAQDELSKKEKDFKKEFEQQQKKLEEAQEKGMSRAEIEKLRKKLEDDLTPKRDQLLALNEKLTAKLQLDIIKAVEKVSKKMGIDIVLDKQVVITGGMDLSEMVISELNK